MGGDPAERWHRPVPDLEGAAVAQFDDAVGGIGRYRDLGAPVQIFLARHRGKAAGLEPHVDDFRQQHAGRDAVGRQVVHLDIALVADDQAMGGVEEAKALRHVVDRHVELQVANPQGFFVIGAGAALLLLQPRDHGFALGDILMRGEAAAVRHRIGGVGDHPSVDEFLHRGGGDDAGCRSRSRIYSSGFCSTLRPKVSRCWIISLIGVPGFTCSGDKPVDIHVALVAEDDLALLVEDDEAERQAVDGFHEQRARKIRVGLGGMRNQIR